MGYTFVLFILCSSLGAMNAASLKFQLVPQLLLQAFSLPFALEKEMATHSSALAWRITRDGGAWWAAVYGVAQSRTRLK